LKYVLKEIPVKKVAKGELEETETLIDIGNIERRFNHLINLEKVDEVGSDKNVLQVGDIIIPKMQPQMGNIFLNLEHERYVGSTELLEYAISKGNNPVFIYYLITSHKFLGDLARLESGKTHRRVNPDDLLKIKIPILLKEKQDKIVSQIEPIEKKIKELKSQIAPAQEVMNRVFAREFGFDLKKFEELKKMRIYQLDFSDVANNKDIRSSVTFHRKSAQFVMDELRRVTNSKIKHFIAEPIVLGASISPADFNENGEYYYVSMATVKNYILELDESQLVSSDYASMNLNKAIKKNDIIMTRSGVSIGKFALVGDDFKGIFADFTMRIRLKNCNPLFAYYYFRSEYFQHLVHTNKKGLQNKNIFPSQIQELPMIDISLEAQQKIVDEIKAELDRQEEMKKKIEAERNKIDEIIEKAVR
jgi:restriction endonuclease S subunit